MKDIILFTKQGWNNIWKQDIVWLFSALPILNSVVSIFQAKLVSNSPLVLLNILVSLILLGLTFISSIAVPYIVYCSLIEKTVDMQDVLFAVRKFLWRVFGCSFLVMLAFSPFIFLALVLFLDVPKRTFQIPNGVILLSPLPLFSAVWPFSLAGFFSKDWGVRQTAKEAWNIFTSHFWVLAILGMALSIIFRVSSSLAAITTVLIQTNFDVTALSQLNYLNLYPALGKNLLFVVLDGIWRIIYVPFDASIFIAAYIKYSGKIPSAQ